MYPERRLDGLSATGTIIRRLAVVLILGATFAVSAMLTVYALFHSGQVRVPNVVGLTETEAKSAIERAGLVFRPRRVHFDAEVPAGTVSEQDPVANFPVKAGFQVKVDLSKGPNPSGEEEHEDIPIGPNVPQQDNLNASTNKKKKPTNVNANGNTNKAPSATNVAPPEQTNTSKGPAKQGDDKKPDTRDDDKPKPAPAKPAPPPPHR